MGAMTSLASTVRCWTFQPASVLHEIAVHGWLRRNWSSHPTNFRPAYDYVRDLLDETIAAPADDLAPIWLWLQFAGRAAPEPPLRRDLQGLYFKPAQNVVRLSVELPREALLPLDFGAWTEIFDLDENGMAEVRIDEEFERRLVRPDPARCHSIQGVAWEIGADAVRAADFLPGRRRASH